MREREIHAFACVICLRLGEPRACASVSRAVRVCGMDDMC